MISISTLRTSQLEGLSSSLAQGERVKEFVEATVRFLTNTRVDGGADSDMIATTGYRLALADVWRHVKPEDLSAAWKAIPVSAVRLFLDDAPRDYAAKILRSLESDSKPSPRPRQIVKVTPAAKKGYSPRAWSKPVVADRATDVAFGFITGLARGSDLAIGGFGKVRKTPKTRAEKLLDAKAAKMARLLVIHDEDDDHPVRGGRRQPRSR